MMSICKTIVPVSPTFNSFPFLFRNRRVLTMLKAVLKKSREGGKGSKKETGMCTKLSCALLKLWWAALGSQIPPVEAR